MTIMTELTLEELKKLIEDAVEKAVAKALTDIRLQAVLGDFDGPDFEPDEKDERTWQEVSESIDRNMWTPPPGAKTSLELLREDRDR